MICQGLFSFSRLLQYRPESRHQIQFDGGFLCVSDRSIDESNYYPFFFFIDDLEFVKGKGLLKTGMTFKESIDLNVSKSTFVGVSWNSHTKVLSLASGVFGIVPLYYYWIENEFVVFANNIPSLINLIPKQYKPEISHFHIVRYLSMDSRFNNRYGETFYSQVNIVPPGNIVTISERSLVTETFLRFDKVLYDGKIGVKRIANLLNKSITEAVGNNNIVGAHLSGGLDSSVISAYGQRALGKESLNTLYFDLQTPSSDEMYYVNKMVETYNFNHSTVIPGKKILEDEIEYIKVLGRPGYGVFPSVAHTSLLNKAASLGCNVMLSGHDGDSIIGFGIYEYFKELFDTNQFNALNDSLVAYAISNPLDHIFANWAYLSEKEKIKKFQQYWWFKQLNRELKSGDSIKFLSLLFEFQKSVGGTSTYIAKTLSTIAGKVTKNQPNGLLKKNLDFKNVPSMKFPFDFLGEYSDAVEGIYSTNSADVSRDLFTLASFKGISIRFPFFNKALFELNMGVSLANKFGGGIGRYHLRKELVGILPEEIRLRTGKGSAGAFSRRSVLELHDQGGGDFLAIQSVLWEFLDRNAVNYSLKRLKNITLSNSESVIHSRQLYRAISTAIWLSRL